MEKIIQISIGSSVFTLEETAYETLKKYLDEIRAAFTNEEGGAEIVKDIEARISEHLACLGKMPITTTDVEDIEKIMGSVAEVTGKNDQPSPAAPEAETPTARIHRRLFRDEDHAILGGVCAGIAAYLDVDPVWVRLATVILAFMSLGTIIVLYVVLWLIVPAAETTSELIEMHGEEVTLRSIKETIRARAEKLKAQSQHSACRIRREAKRMAREVKREAKRLEREAKYDFAKNTNGAKEESTVRTEPIVTNTACTGEADCKHCEKRFEKVLEDGIQRRVAEIGAAFHRVFQVTGAIIRIAIGLVIGMVGIGLIVGASAACAGLLSLNQFPDFAALATQPHVTLLLTLAALALAVLVLIPAILMILGGITLIRKRPLFRVRYPVAIFGIWMLALVATNALGFALVIKYEHAANSTHDTIIDHTTDGAGLVSLPETTSTASIASSTAK